MAISPVVRYMLPCLDWEFDPTDEHRINVLGLLSFVQCDEDADFPVRVAELCVVLVLTECYKSGSGRIDCVVDENERRVFSSHEHRIASSGNPLDVVVVPFRIRNCPFPATGVYSLQFWFDGELLQQCSLRVR